MIRKRKGSKGNITYQVYIRYTDKYGIKKSYCKSGFQGLRLAQRHEKKVLSLIQNDNMNLMTYDHLTFNQVFLEYMEIEGASKYAISTYNTYMSKFRKHIQDTIGKCLLHSLKYKEIQSFFNGLDNNSKALNLDIKKIFQVTFSYAIKNEYIDRNPMNLISVSGRETCKTKKIISKRELELLVERLEQIAPVRKDPFEYYSYIIALYVGFYCGTRISETLALEKNDFDLDKGYVVINKRLESKDKDSGLYVTSKLKTEASKASIPVCNTLKEILVEWFAYNKNDLVCSKGNGDYIRYEQFDRVTSKEAKKLGFIFHSHMLRHSFTTNLLKHDVSPKTASELCRHAQVSTTLDIYVHPSESDKEKAIQNTFKN